jgi:hypothetical protein
MHPQNEWRHLGSIEDVLGEICRIGHQIKMENEELSRHTRGRSEYHRVITPLVLGCENLGERLDSFEQFRDEYERDHSDPA